KFHVIRTLIARSPKEDKADDVALSLLFNSTWRSNGASVLCGLLSPFGLALLTAGTILIDVHLSSAFASQPLASQGTLFKLRLLASPFASLAACAALLTVRSHLAVEAYIEESRNRGMGSMHRHVVEAMGGGRTRRCFLAEGGGGTIRGFIVVRFGNTCMVE
ncbi:hypothetical protein TrRE_jg1597, partial [Triparma retinervis]